MQDPNLYSFASLTIIASLIIGCSSSTPPLTVLPTPSGQVASQSPVITSPPQADSFADAMSKGLSAATLAQSSHSKEDWGLVVSVWSEAIALLKAVPLSNPNYAVAQKKLAEYQKNLSYATKQPIATQAAALVNIVQPQKIVAPLAAQPKLQPAKVQSSAVMLAESGQESAQSFLKTYFVAVINEGTDGDKYWCRESKSLKESLFSPRDYKILGVQKRGTKTDPAYRFQVTVNSSNRAGTPIANNWGFYITKEKNKTQNWCLGFVAH